MVDFIRTWSEKTGLLIDRLLGWLELSAGKFYDWRQRYGKTNQHNGWVPRDFWLTEEEKKAILNFASSEKSVGHRYAPMGAGSSARAARKPDVGWRGFSFSCS